MLMRLLGALECYVALLRAGEAADRKEPAGFVGFIDGYAQAIHECARADSLAEVLVASGLPEVAGPAGIGLCEDELPRDLMTAAATHLCAPNGAGATEGHEEGCAAAEALSSRLREELGLSEPQCLRSADASLAEDLLRRAVAAGCTPASRPDPARTADDVAALPAPQGPVGVFAEA